MPEEGCVGKIGSICEVPVFGTASIHIGGTSPDKSTNLKQDYPEANPVVIRPKSPAQNVEGIEIYRDGKRVVGSQPAGKTATMTIYGAIATNPALPCCKCC